MKCDPVVKVEPGLKPSPNSESKLDVPDDDEEAKMIIQMVNVDIQMTKKSHWRENIMSKRVFMWMMIVEKMKMLLQVHTGA